MLFVCTAINAREWHINNANGMPAHFADINAAMASEEVVAGDTLYIGAGAVLGAQTISKAVTVIGTGWGYGDSPVTPANVNGNLKITAEYAKVIGLHVIGEIQIRASYITIERCRIDAGIQHSEVRADYVKILQSYSTKIYAYYNNNAGWEIKNNILNYGYWGGHNSLFGLYYAVIENNVIRSTSTYQSGILNNCSSCIIKNNIMLCNYDKDYYIRQCSNNYMQHNVLSASSGYSGNIMIGTTDLSTLFKCTGSASSGEYYSLKEDSPAIGAGENGIDCGVMAGAYRFVPFGRPRNIPVLKWASVPVMPTDGKVKVSFKIENQNE